MNTLFDKYGGFATVSKIVREFYRQILLSPSLKPYFENVNMERLMDHQTKFIAHVLGGPSEYTGQAIGVAHARLSITEESFGEVASILQEVLEDAGMEKDDVTTVMEIVGSTKSSIVAKQ
jgi:hemoglobin